MRNNKYIRAAKISLIITYMCMGLLYAGEAYAQTQSYTIVPLTTLPGLTTAGTPISPTTYIQGLYAFAIGIGAVIAVITGVVAGVEYMLSESSIASKSKAIERIKNVGWGAALLFCSYLLLSIINPQLINWNLNLGTINTNNLKADVTANQAALQQINAQTNAAMQAMQTSQQAAVADQTTLNALQDECNNGTPGSPDFGILNPDVCDSTDPTSQISQATAAANAAQSTVLQNNATLTTTQVAAGVRTALDTNSPATAQADLSTADQLLTNDANQATALGNTAVASQINAQKTVMDSTAAQALALATVAQLSQQPSGTDVLTEQNALSINNALTTINSANNQIAQLRAAGQTDIANSLQTQTAGNLASLKQLITTEYGSTCTTSNFVNKDNISVSGGCPQP